MVSRCTIVDRSLSQRQVLEATGRKLYVEDDIVETMPNGTGAEIEVHFFNLGCSISDNKLEHEFGARGLVPCDPHTLANVNQDDPAFADDYPNCTHWKDSDGKWCFVSFDRWNGERGVDVRRDHIAWGGGWWFAGVCK
jgi:hypothetical protein